MWIAAQSLATRGITSLQQLVLVWLLAKKDFGLIGLAYSVTMFVNLLSNPGIDAVLIQRQRRFRLWATPALWLGMTTGLVGSVLMVAAAPMAAWAYGRPALVGLILVLAIAPPLQALQMVPRAKLQTELRIKHVAMLNILNSMLTTLLTIAAAAAGFGAYSFVLPVPIVSLIVALAAWRLAGPKIRPRPEYRRWKYLISDSASLGGTRVLQTIVGQGDYIGLGLAGVSDVAIGTYFVAYRLSTQTFMLMASSIPGVLFPSLSKLEFDPELQLRSVRRATRLLALVTIPFCLLQALLAGPVIRLLCPPGWTDAVLPLQMLTVGIMINAPCWPTQSLMMSQRRFQTLFRLALGSVALFCVIIAVALTISPGIISVAAAVACWQFWNTPAFWIAAFPGAKVYAYFVEISRPLAAGLVALLPCALLLHWLPESMIADGISLVVIPVVFCSLFAALVRQLARSDYDDFLKQVAPFLKRLARNSEPRTDGVHSKAHL